MLEVGYFLRYFEIRPYQRMQGHLLRKKLELLEHLVEDILAADESSESQLGATSEGNLTFEHERLDQLRQEITLTSRRLSVASRLCVDCRGVVLVRLASSPTSGQPLPAVRETNRSAEGALLLGELAVLSPGQPPATGR